MTYLTPQEEDPIVHELLANLEQFSPSPGFADRVMSQVWRPAPSWVQQVTHVFDSARGRKRAWMIAGGLATTSFIAMITAVVATLTYLVHIETAWAVVTGMAMDLWRMSVRATAGLSFMAMRWLELFAVNQTMLIVLALTSSVVLGVSALGLQHTIRQYRNERLLLDARR